MGFNSGFKGLISTAATCQCYSRTQILIQFLLK